MSATRDRFKALGVTNEQALDAIEELAADGDAARTHLRKWHSPGVHRAGGLTHVCAACDFLEGDDE